MVNRYCHCCRNCYIFILAFYWSAAGFCRRAHGYGSGNLLSSCTGIGGTPGSGQINCIVSKARIADQNRTSLRIQENHNTCFDKTGTLTVGKFEVSVSYRFRRI